MLCTAPGRNAQGRPLKGVDVVPEKKPPIGQWKPLFASSSSSSTQTRDDEEDTIPKLVKLLQKANKRADNAEDGRSFWCTKYHDLYNDYMALKYEDICESCQLQRETKPPGKTLTLCTECSKGKQTIQSLQTKLEKKQEEIKYWQDCYETALSQLGDVPDTSLSQKV